jgi:hypothetical protein
MLNHRIEWIASSSRLLALLVLGASPLALGGVARADEAQKPDFVARWFPACDAPADAAYFTVNVFVNGDVEYFGGAQAQESGARTFHIKTFDARRVLNRGADFIRAPAAPARAMRKPGTCMEFTTLVGGEMRTRREPVETKVADVFTKDFILLVPVRAWVCPGRGASDGAPAPAWGDLCKKRKGDYGNGAAPGS